MARKTREEKTLEHGSLVIEDLKKLYNTDGVAYVEYKHLFDEYKKISKRFGKTVQMNDSVGKSVIVDNEQLKDNVEYTVKLAKKKILHNIEEHKKTKEVLARHSETDREIINGLKRELRDLRQYSQKLEQDLNKSDEVTHQFVEAFDPVVKPKDINSSSLNNQSYQSILSKKIDLSVQTSTSLTVAKLIIDDFKQKREQLDANNIDKLSLIRSFYKFFSISLGAKHTVYYFSDNIFYLVFMETTIEESKKLISKINVPRKLSQITFTFSVGVTQFQDKTDNFASLNQRCNEANKQASKENMKNSLIVK